MNKYKFRAWDLSLGKMVNWERLLIRYDLNEMFKNGFDIEYMQCTEIEDKNNVEVYEGDIVKNYTEIEQPQGLLKHTFIGKIVIERGMTYIIGRIKQEYNGEVIIEHHRVLAFSPEIFEVIGNIYENSELLEIE